MKAVKENVSGRGSVALPRRQFIGLAATTGAVAVLLPRLRSVLAAAPGEKDIPILNYVLTLELLEADFYSRGVEAGALQARELELVESILSHEQDHVSSITSLVEDLGGEPVEESFTYPSGLFDSQDEFLEAALELEELGVSAYHGQLTAISERQTLDALVAIAAIESRHASAIATLLGGDSLPAPLERGKSRSQVLRQTQPFLEA